MKQEPINRIIEKAKNLNKLHKNWHFHMLGRNIDQRKGKGHSNQC